MIVVNFCGQLANGKSVCANYLAGRMRSLLGGEWPEVSFARPVKDIFCKAFGVDIDFVEKWKRIKDAPPGFNMNVRKSLQFIGDGFRAVQNHCWINMLISGIKNDCVCADGRYLNEAKAIKSINGTNVVIWRPGHENDDANKSESEIWQIVKYCIDTKQDGVIDKSSAPEEIHHYDYFLINRDIKSTYGKIDNDLIPFVMRKYDR